MENTGIKKAIELISFENLSPEERALAKNKESGKITLAKLRRVEKIEIVQNCILEGADNDFIVRITKLSLEEVERNRREVGLNIRKYSVMPNLQHSL